MKILCPPSGLLFGGRHGDRMRPRSALGFCLLAFLVWILNNSLLSIHSDL
jgi:hypothetical protein